MTRLIGAVSDLGGYVRSRNVLYRRKPIGLILLALLLLPSATMNIFTSLVPFADSPWHKSDSEHSWYNESHRALQRARRIYADKEIRPYAGEWEKNEEIPEKVRIPRMPLLSMIPSGAS